jgi:hypothetical protein
MKNSNKMNNYWKGNQQKKKVNVFTIAISNYFDAIGFLEEKNCSNDFSILLILKRNLFCIVHNVTKFIN